MGNIIQFTADRIALDWKELGEFERMFELLSLLFQYEYQPPELLAWRVIAWLASLLSIG